MTKKSILLTLIVLPVFATAFFSTPVFGETRLPAEKGAAGPLGISEEALNRRQDQANTAIQRRKDLSDVVRSTSVETTIYLSSNADHYFSVKEGSSATLDDLFQGGIIASSPTPGQRTTEVLFFSNDPPGEKESASGVYYFWNGQWMKIGGGVVGSSTKLSLYFIIRQNPAAKTLTAAPPKTLVYHGSTPQNSENRPWSNFTISLSTVRIVRNVDTRTGSELISLASIDGKGGWEVYRIDLARGEVSYETGIPQDPYGRTHSFFDTQNTPKGWRQSIESIIEVLDWTFNRSTQDGEKSRILELKGRLSRALEQHALDRNAEEDSRLIFEEEGWSYAVFYASGFKGINLKNPWTVRTNGAVFEIFNPGLGPGYIYDVFKKEIRILTSTGTSVYNRTENLVKWRRTASRMFAALTEVEKRASMPALVAQIRAMRVQIIVDFLVFHRW
ncbi:MAG: hypothetical protein HYT89_00430 [Candidatus Omnitrophica bacterium]|nr:hypothetical protein [Candidatus Omnitrophota bacterium]